MKSRTKSLVVTTVVAGVMAVASLGWACTVLVGPTVITGSESTPPSPNSNVSAVGFASHDREPTECGTSPCDYEIVSVSTAAALSCHFDDGQEDKKAEATESPADVPRVTELNGTVEAPGSTGPAVVCFRSKETFVGSTAPAAGTSGAPFLVLN